MDADGTAVPKGLEGVRVAETAISEVRGREGFYHYRGHDAIALARSCRFEQVWHLLVEGRLPDDGELAAFEEEIRRASRLPGEAARLLPEVASLGEPYRPLEALRTAYSLMVGALGMPPWLDEGVGRLRQQALATGAMFPVLVTSLERLRRGLDPIAPDGELSYAANYLYMISGEVPAAEHVRALDAYLISTIDHGFNASTFTARVVASTGADLGSAVIAALGALSGPLHGGAPGRALDMLDEIGRAEQAEGWLRSQLEEGRRLMGFGHRVYRTDDPRSVMLHSIARELGGDRVALAEAVEKQALALLAEHRPGRDLYTNVEFYAGVVLDRIGLPRELFTPTFACARVIGWTAHVLEQAAANRLIRPSASYVGPDPDLAAAG